MLANYTTSEIEAELTRRANMSRIPKPSPRATVDWRKVHDLGIEYVNDDEANREDLEQYIFEAVLDAVYDNPWPYINAR